MIYKELLHMHIIVDEKRHMRHNSPPI